MPSKAGDKALAIFFLVFAAGLVIFILTQGINIYQGSKGYVADTTQPSVDCIKYFYEIDNIGYDETELRFTVENLDYSEDFNNVTVVGLSSQVLPLQLLKGTSQQIRVAINLNQSFVFYPEGCAVYKTTCTLSGECSSR